ncbi:hypothetical protein A2U01_0056648, partial [Trifolium medium]|nr:hypothetical protein [Trifolium medium]
YGHQLLRGLGGPHPWRVEEDLHVVGVGHHSHVPDCVRGLGLQNAVYRFGDGGFPAYARVSVTTPSELIGISSGVRNNSRVFEDRAYSSSVLPHLRSSALLSQG